MNKLLLALPLALVLTACDEQIHQNSDEQQHHAQEQMAKQANMEVGMPAIVNFQEKRILKDIYERRDKAIVTITYTQDLNAGLHKLCDSIGYGIPAATQYTNPMRIGGGMEAPSQGNVTLPQADPNGLFSPASAEGTWVMCKDPNSDKVEPIYSEPRIIVSTFPLK